MKKTFIRYMCQDELIVHLNDIINRFDAWHLPTTHAKEWCGEDSFGAGWCFFEKGSPSDSVIEHYSGDRYKVTIELTQSETYFRKYIGVGVYYPHGQRETATELHIPYIPWWMVTKITICDQLIGTNNTYFLDSDVDWSEMIRNDFAQQLAGHNK